MTTQLTVNLTDLQDALSSLALADHMGDINNDLPWLAKVLGLPTPVWSDERDRMLWEWDEDYEEEEDDGDAV